MMNQAHQQRGTVVVVDDTDVSADVLRRHLIAEGYSVNVAHDGPSGLQTVRQSPPDLVLLDVVMPGMDGFDVCRRLKADPATRLTPIVLITALDAPDDRIQGLEAGADDFLTKPFDLRELRARVRGLLRVKHLTDELDSAEQVIVNLARTIEARDPSTEGHCERLAAYATALGAALGLSPGELNLLHRGGLVHDIGKIAVPDAILLKAGPLTAGEFEVMKRHTTAGEALCADFRALRAVRPIIRHHHERLDGSGYPDGLKGAAIPLLAQVVGVADVFDALTTVRPYKAALTFEAAVEALRNEAARGLHDPAIVERLVLLHQTGQLECALTSTVRTRHD